MSVWLSVCMHLFPTVFPLFCPGLKASFRTNSEVSCPHSCLHPITASGLIACLAGKRYCVCVCVCMLLYVFVCVFVYFLCDRHNDWKEGQKVCECVSDCVLGSHYTVSDPEWTPDWILITGTLHGVSEKSKHTQTRSNIPLNTHTPRIVKGSGM